MKTEEENQMNSNESNKNVSIRHIQESLDLRLNDIRENPASFLERLQSVENERTHNENVLHERIRELETQIDALKLTLRIQNIPSTVLLNVESDPARWIPLGLANKCVKCGTETKWTWHDGLGNSIPKCKPACVSYIITGLPKELSQILKSLEEEEDNDA